MAASYPTPKAQMENLLVILTIYLKQWLVPITYVIEDKNVTNRQEAGITSKTDSLSFSRKGTINLVQLEKLHLKIGNLKTALLSQIMVNPVKNGLKLVSEESNANQPWS